MLRWLGTKFRLKNMKGKRSLGRPRHRLEDNIKMGLKEIWFGV
jgi:hypothetical protein